MASFLGNVNWDQLEDVLGYAAEMYRPGGDVARYDQNRLATKLLKEKLAERQQQQAAKSRLIGGKDPTTGITWETGRQAPSGSVHRMQYPDELADVPRTNGRPMDPAMMMEDDLQLAEARKTFSRNQQDDMMQAFPEAAEAALVSRMSPKLEKVGKSIVRISGDDVTPLYTDNSDDMTPYQKAQIEAQNKRLELEGQRVDALIKSQGAAADRAANSQAVRDRPKNTAYVSLMTGNPVRQDPVSGNYLGDNDTVVDPKDIMPSADFNKQAVEARGAVAGLERAKALRAKVDAMPSAFDEGKVNDARWRGRAPFYGEQYASARFTDDEKEVRAAVMRDAAMIINELYGAALSTGESDRAKGFTPDANDTLEMLLPKLKSAQEWAEQKLKGYVPSAVETAKRQLGGGAKSSGGWSIVRE